MSAGRFVDVEAVLFDLDGTLIDTVDDIALAANRTLAELGRPVREVAQIRTFVGKGIPNLVTRCMTEGATASQDEITAAVAVFLRHYTEVNGVHATVYPTVRETLAALRQMGIKLACVTNKAEAYTLALLERVGLAECFEVVVSGDTLPVKKPDPAMLHHARKALGVRCALMVGDSANDALAARAAGMPVLLVTYGYSEGVPVDTIECDGLISSASEALDRIQRH